MSKRVTHDEHGRFFVGDLRVLEWRNDVISGPLDALEDVSLTSIRHALHRHMIEMDCEFSEESLEVHVSAVRPQDFDRDFSPLEPVSLHLDGSEWSLVVEMWRDEPLDEETVGRLLSPLLTRWRSEFIGCDCEQYSDEPGACQVTVQVDLPSRGRTVGEAIALGREVERLLGASTGGKLTLDDAQDIIVSGSARLLLGHAESQWLEAKGVPYRLADPDPAVRAEQAWELAKDVAAFANSETGGLILLGATTRDQGDGDRIRGFREFDLREVRRQAHRNHVAQKIYPRVRGFDVVHVPGSRPGQGLGLIVVPAQDEADKPFLVRGILREGSLLGAHILWPVRREDDTATVPVERIHAQLRLGEQRLR